MREGNKTVWGRSGLVVEVKRLELLTELLTLPPLWDLFVNVLVLCHPPSLTRQAVKFLPHMGSVVSWMMQVLLRAVKELRGGREN